MTEAVLEPQEKLRPKAKPAPNRTRIPASGDDFNEVERVILQRRSVRNFKKTQVPEYLVNRVLECGRFAPSAGNNQSWKFVIVRDPELIEEMTTYTRGWARRAAKLLDPTFPGAVTTAKTSAVTNLLLSKIAASMGHPTGLSGVSQLASGELGLWHGAPTVILLLVDTRGTGKPYLDLGIAGQNMVLAAHSMGLGTCWVSFAMFLERSRKYRKMFGIEPPMRLATSLALGFPLSQPDGFVTRETHATDWFEPGGKRRVVY
jgi:nitroreductase